MISMAPPTPTVGGATSFPPPEDKSFIASRWPHPCSIFYSLLLASSTPIFRGATSFPLTPTPNFEYGLLLARPTPVLLLSLPPEVACLNIGVWNRLL